MKPLVLLLFLILACAALLPGCTPAPATVRKGVESPAVRGVRVSTVAYRLVSDDFDAVGTVRSERRVVLSARLTAHVTAVLAREGDRVRAGQPLVELDSRDVQAGLRKAEAALVEAREGLVESRAALVAASRGTESVRSTQLLASANFKRASYLLERNVIPTQAYDEAQAHVSGATADLERTEALGLSSSARQRQAQARLELAQADLKAAHLTASYAHITASIAGVVVSRSVEVGNLAAPGLTLFTLDEERYRLEATVRDSETGGIRLGQKAIVSLQTLGETTSGTVVEIVPAADPLSRTSIVKLELAGIPGLRSGLYGKAAFSHGETRLLLVPARAVVSRGQLTSVFALDAGDVARMRLVTLGKRAGDSIEVLSGLDAGDRIVTDGVERVIDSSRIEVASP